jgi:ATP-dependent DNA helicase RecG
MHESDVVEWKSVLKSDLNKEVVAFANSSGGTIYLGIDDTGEKTGLDNIEDDYSRLVNIIRDTILPDLTMFVSYELLEGKIIKLTVSEGTAKPYFLKKNGLKPAGVYVRQGSSSAQASWEQIRQLIKLTAAESFEKTRSLVQELSFLEAKAEFSSRKLDFGQDKYSRLGFQDSGGLFTNLALLLSDQCHHSVKLAVYADQANTVFLDRREVSGSIFRQLREVYNFLLLNNRTQSEIKGLYRVDRMDYPEAAIREALLNSLVHRDYSYSGSILININEARMEFISLGGLVAGLTTADILSGISQTRNPGLVQIFYRLKHIEAYGTGLRRIYDLYKDSPVQPDLAVTANTFRLSLPNLNFARASGLVKEEGANYQARPQVTRQMEKVLAYLASHGWINDENLMTLLDIKKTRAYLLGKQMEEMGLIIIKGRGKDKKIRLRDPQAL